MSERFFTVMLTKFKSELFWGQLNQLTLNARDQPYLLSRMKEYVFTNEPQTLDKIRPAFILVYH